MPFDQPPQICRTMEVTPGQQRVIEGVVDDSKLLRSFAVPAGVRHLSVCLNRGNVQVKLHKSTG
jgi:hypothetical protein